MAKSTRRRGLGDFPDGSPLALAVEAFREKATLIESAPDDSLVRFAFEEGQNRPGAAEVRAETARTRGKPPGWWPRRAHVATEAPQGGDATPESAEAHTGDPGASDEAQGCDHELQDELTTGEVVCQACGEILGKVERDPNCQHTWAQRGQESALLGLGLLVRVFDHCSLCGAPRPLCESGGHRALVESSDATYCSTCGEVVSVITDGWDAPATEVIHHPALTNESTVRTESGPPPRPRDELREEDIRDLIEEALPSEDGSTEEDLLW